MEDLPLFLDKRVGILKGNKLVFLNSFRHHDSLLTTYYCLPVIGAMASPEWKEHLDKHQKKIKDVEDKYEAKAKENKVYSLGCTG